MRKPHNSCLTLPEVRLAETRGSCHPAAAGLGSGRCGVSCFGVLVILSVRPRPACAVGSASAGVAPDEGLLLVGFSLVDRGIPEGEAVVLDVPQPQTLLRKSFNLGIEIDRRAPRALVRLQLAN